MKKLYCILIALVALLASCNKNDKPVTSADVEGSWSLVSFGGVPAGELSVWLDFNGKSFNIYQRSSSKVFYDLYSGTWSVKDGVLSGQYSDGSSWASTYKVSIQDGVQMTLTANGSGEESIYTRTSLPADISSQIRSDR